LGGPSSQPSTPPSTATGYTIIPPVVLSQTTPTNIAMAAFAANFNNGKRTAYGARNFTITPPAAGATATYYVTIYDPLSVGDTPGMTNLAAQCSQTPTNATAPGYIFAGTITVTHDAIGAVASSGGSAAGASAESGFLINGQGGSGQSTQIDLLSYAAMDSRRASFHLQGSAANSPSSKFYSYIDPSTHSLAFIKAPAGWACDILLYDPTYIYQFITELDDADHRNWSINTSYKKLIVSHGYPLSGPLPIMPRFFTPGQAPVSIDVPAPNQYNRYIACSVIDTKDKGHTTNITYGPVMMNFDSDGTTVGNLGTIPVMINERYAGNSARERFFLGLNLGLVKWDAGSLISGVRITGQYKITNWSVHNQLVAGGGVTPSFGCGYGVGWP
jgi:hypothetical protein